jgi:hypothetical protein
MWFPSDTQKGIQLFNNRHHHHLYCNQEHWPLSLSLQLTILFRVTPTFYVVVSSRDSLPWYTTV